MIFKIKHIRHLFQNKQNSFWVCLLSLFFAFQSFSQNNSTDVEALIESVSQQLQNSVTDSTQVYKNMFKSVRLSKQVKDKKLLAKSYQNLAIWHQNNVTLDSTLYYLEKAQTTLKATDFNKLKAKNHLIKEDAHKDKREYSKALEADFKALKIYENINDQKGIAECYTRLCDLLYYQEKYTNGAEYCQQAIEIQKQLNVPKNLALSYRYKADNLLMLQEYEQALENISSAITVLENAGISKVSIAKNYNTRGNIYKHMNRFDDAIAEYQKCYQIATEHNAYNGVYVALANIGHVYRLQNNYDKALPYTLEAIEMMKKSGNIQNLRENYMHASDSYEALDQYKEALEYERLHSKMISDDSQEMIAQLESELQAKYESDKKDETIEAQDATISRQRQIQLLYIGIAVLLGFFLFACLLYTSDAADE